MPSIRKCQVVLAVVVLVLTACGTANETTDTREPFDGWTAERYKSTYAWETTPDEEDAMMQLAANHANRNRAIRYVAAVHAANTAAIYAATVQAGIEQAERARADAERRIAVEGEATEPARRAVVPDGPGSVNGYPCGGNLPPCYVLRRESGGNPTAENPVSTASGLWQFLDGTWNNYGGYSHAADAPPSVQNEKAALTWAGGAGCSHWSAC